MWAEGCATLSLGSWPTETEMHEFCFQWLSWWELVMHQWISNTVSLWCLLSWITCFPCYNLHPGVPIPGSVVPLLPSQTCHPLSQGRKRKEIIFYSWLLSPWILKNLFIWEGGRKKERERKRRKRELVSTGSLLKCPQFPGLSQEWNQGNSNQVSHVGGRIPVCWDITSTSQGPLAGSWSQESQPRISVKHRSPS